MIRIDDDTINMLDAAPTVLTHIALGGVRMAELELAESVMVMGLGVLGISAVELCRMSGAYPIIAVDPNPKRREKALSFGADIALDPKAKDFTERVLGVTCGEGVNVVIEVSGADIALDQALECTARMARVVLLGCTRENNRPTDYYHLVHYKGVKILGAHTFVRPEHDSRRGYWTYRDDCKSVLALISGERISPGRIIEEIYLPEQAPEVFKRLAEDPNFPIGVAFDWRNVK